jgi:branched-chain amino acid transport system ATP-binding protein
LLTVDQINVFYGDAQALWDLGFKVNKGEIVTIVGSNGAGKTTTVKAISGLLHSKSGSINFLGTPIDRLPPHRIVDLGLVQIPEGRRLFPYMTVLENLEVGAYTARARRERNDTLEWVYQLFPALGERKNQLAGTLSGGEQQMVALGRGLMSRPRLIMLDEPSIGLAPRLVLTVFETVKKIREEGVTVLLIEQNVRNALEISDRGYVLETGRIVLGDESKKLIDIGHVKKAYLGM